MNNVQQRKLLQKCTLQNLITPKCATLFTEDASMIFYAGDRGESIAMLETIRRVLLAILLFGLSIIPISAQAQIIQETTVLYRPTAPVGFPGDPADIDVDRTTNFGGPIDRVTFAHVSGSAYDVASSIDQFGNLGVSGFIRGDSGTISGEVEARSDEYINTAAVAQQAEANFVIDGGLFTLIASPGSSLRYSLRVTLNSRDIFRSTAELNAVATINGFLANTFTTSGDDMGATYDDSSFTLTIPLSFQSIDLGLIQPNEQFSLGYEFYAVGQADSFAETLEFQFSDPLRVSFTDNFPVGIAFFDPLPASVPQPATLTLLLSGLGFMQLVGLNKAGIRK
ncbi:MAG: hypothetical protein methR_P3889 [Methyloprofundus sp.]|nr:MAG: hypothetical protein methR_P3889 [Methyloprofundus sp.]